MFLLDLIHGSQMSGTVVSCGTDKSVRTVLKEMADISILPNYHEWGFERTGKHSFRLKGRNWTVEFSQ